MGLCQCGTTKNILFIILLSITTILRKTDTIIMKILCSFEGTIIQSWLMFGSEFLIGLANIYLEYKKLLNREQSDLMGVPLVLSASSKKTDRSCKIVIFLALAASFDFSSSLILNYFLFEKFGDDYGFLNMRIKLIQIIFSSLLCAVLLSKQIHLHQIIALILVLIGISSMIILEIFPKLENNNNNSIELSQLLIIIFLSYVFMSIRDCIEKYLMDFNYSTQFKILFYEGFFGIIFMIILNFFKFKGKYLPEGDIDYVWVLVVGFIFFFILSSFINVYRLTVIKFFSPMGRTISDSFVALAGVLYFFIFDQKEKQREFIYKIINSVAVVLITFSSILYNEIIIFGCCGVKKMSNQNFNAISDASLDNPNKSGLTGSADYTSEGDESF